MSKRRRSRRQRRSRPGVAETRSCSVAYRYRQCNVRLPFWLRWRHGREKRDAMYALFAIRNPGAVLRLTWLDGGKPLGGARRRPQADPADQAANRSQALFNALSLFVAAIGSIAGVLALFRLKMARTARVTVQFAQSLGRGRSVPRGTEIASRGGRVAASVRLIRSARMIKVDRGAQYTDDPLVAGPHEQRAEAS
jgi:hypothetical protein